MVKHRNQPTNGDTMDYYDGYQGRLLDYQQVLRLLRQHGAIISKEYIRTFDEECWSPHHNRGAIQAQRVLDWLGY
jgi:hypothetical protein